MTLKYWCKILHVSSLCNTGTLDLRQSDTQLALTTTGFHGYDRILSIQNIAVHPLSVIKKFI